MALRHLGFSAVFLVLAGSFVWAQKPAAASSNTPEARFFTALAAAAQDAVSPVGGQGGTAFKEVFPEGGILVGFDVWQGPYGDAKSVIKAICPIYQTVNGRHRGQVQGEKEGSLTTVEAKPGDAVVALSVRTGVVVDGLRVQFQKIDYFGFKLTASSSYKSEAIGGEGGSKQVFPITSNGKPIVGIQGGAGRCIDRIGLITAAIK